MYSSAKPSLDSASSLSTLSSRPPSNGSDSSVVTNVRKSENSDNNNNNNNYVISAYAGPMMEKEAKAFRMRLCRPFRSSVRQLIASRDSPRRTLEKCVESASESTASSAFDATTSTTTTTGDEIKSSSGDGPSGDDGTSHTTLQLPANIVNGGGLDLPATAGNDTASTDGSGEALTKTEKDSSPIFNTDTTKVALHPPASSSSSSEKMSSNFVTPVKVTPPWSLGSATRSIGSGDVFQRCVLSQCLSALCAILKLYTDQPVTPTHSPNRWAKFANNLT